VTEFKYRAFISYSHGADGNITPQLHRALSRFARPWRKIRALRIFRDQTNLSVNPHLWAHIQEALDQSQYFILLASPEAAASPWVRQEIAHWLATRSADTMLIVLTKGEIVWDRSARDFDWAKTTALPATLGGVFPDEPLYSDLRDSRTAADLSLRNPDFMNRVARIAATLHGRSLDELIESDANTGPKAQPFVDEAESPDRTLVLRQTGAGLHVADLRTGTAMASWTRHADVVASAAFSPDGVLVASVDEGGDGYVWDARTGQLRHAFRSPVPGNGFSSVVWSPDGRLLAAGAGREVQVRETGKWQQIAMLDEHSGSVDQIAFSRDGVLLATGSTMVYPGGEAADRTVHVWDARTGRVLQELTDPRRELDDVGFSADGMQVVVSYGDGTVRISDAMSGEEIALRSSSGVRVAPGLDQPVRTIMAAVVKLQDDYQNGIANLGFTADGRFLVTVDKEGAARMWRRPTLVQHPIEPGAANIDGVAASDQRSVTSPDGHVAIELVTEAGAGTAIIVDRTHAVTVGTLSGSAEGPVAAAFSPDGLLIAIADGSEDVRIYRWESFAPLDDQIALARARAGRELRPVERAQFVPPTFGQLLRRWLVPST
jgi:WD40 repeat protein